MKLTLTSLDQRAHKDFDSLEFEVEDGVCVHFGHPMRMTPEWRANLAEAAKRLGNKQIVTEGDPEDPESTEVQGAEVQDAEEAIEESRGRVRDVIQALLVDPKEIKVLDKALGERTDLWLTLMNAAWEALSVGEA